MLVKININSELRRFVLDDDKPFDDLLAKLQQLLGANAAFSLCYEDNEEDKIVVSSNDELREAWMTKSPETSSLRMTVNLAATAAALAPVVALAAPPVVAPSTTTTMEMTNANVPLYPMVSAAASNVAMGVPVSAQQTTPGLFDDRKMWKRQEKLARKFSKMQVVNVENGNNNSNNVDDNNTEAPWSHWGHHHRFHHYHHGGNGNSHCNSRWEKKKDKLNRKMEMSQEKAVHKLEKLKKKECELVKKMSMYATAEAQLQQLGHLNQGLNYRLLKRFDGNVENVLAKLQVIEAKMALKHSYAASRL